ncbi:very short patch repair endonuclease [Leptolyngbya sp. 15MV]|nr:very short patch repair endonuclease [Leptolyngbya sp. 15MV]
MRRDRLSKDQRRRAMQANRGRTRPERRVAAALWKAGFRYLTADGYRTRAGRRFPGSPDLIFVGRRCVVFVDGCFWHGCGRCHDFARDLSAWWRAKIERNVSRDKRVRGRLRRQGWTVLVVREHNLATPDRFAGTIGRLTSRIPPRRYDVGNARRRRQAQGH